jgi:hypothetical protein
MTTPRPITAFLLLIATCQEATSSEPLQQTNNKWSIANRSLDQSSVDWITTPWKERIDSQWSTANKSPTVSNTKQKHGHLTVDLQGNSFGRTTRFDSNDDTSPELLKRPTEVIVSIDPAATARLVSIALAVTGSFISAFMGTLRLLAPL